jgi:hypothetical protein
LSIVRDENIDRHDKGGRESEGERDKGETKKGEVEGAVPLDFPLKLRRNFLFLRHFLLAPLLKDTSPSCSGEAGSADSNAKVLGQLDGNARIRCNAAIVIGRARSSRRTTGCADYATDDG